ncbi:MAG: DUF2322 family protein [Hydrogenophilaceae bacterium]|nr:DUF2322 family protein [Hydrogenophilaceae bacterium]
MVFKDNLEALPQASGKMLILLDDSNVEVTRIANGPGTAGSFRVYAYLAGKWGGINAEAAEEGLRLYAEHTEDARKNPGRHPNIDRLFDVRRDGKNLRVVIE